MWQSTCGWMVPAFVALLVTGGCDQSASDGGSPQPAGQTPSRAAATSPTAGGAAPATATAAGTPGSTPTPAAGGPVDAEVVRILAEQMKVPAANVQRGTRLVEDMKADELDRVEIVMALERHFNIRIRDEEAAKLQTVGQVADLVRDRTKK